MDNVQCRVIVCLLPYFIRYHLSIIHFDSMGSFLWVSANRRRVRW